MGTTLRKIEGTDGDGEQTQVKVHVFAGHSSLLETEKTRRCIQITVKRQNTVGFAYLTDSGLDELINQLMAVRIGHYQKYAE